MTLDINTPKGQESLQQEQEMLQIIKRSAPAFEFAQTPKEASAEVDGIVMKDRTLIAVFESKCRNMSHKDLAGSFGNEWLITYEKLVKGASIARSFQIPFVGYLFLVPDKKVLSVVICNKNGDLIPKIRVERTETQKTINGGLVTRTNAYIDMETAKVFA
jgi:hypothetical protein